MATLHLALEAPQRKTPRPNGAGQYPREKLRRGPWAWDQSVKESQLTNFGYQRSCSFDLAVNDDVVLREEQAACDPLPSDLNAFAPVICAPGLSDRDTCVEIRARGENLGRRQENPWRN